MTQHRGLKDAALILAIEPVRVYPQRGPANRRLSCGSLCRLLPALLLFCTTMLNARPSNVLADYVAAADPTYSWREISSGKV